MNEKFTNKAQNALNSALEYAREMGHSYIGSEHLLLGLLSETDSIASKVLTGRGVTLEECRSIIEKNAGVGASTDVSPSEMTPRTKRIISLSAYESSNAGHSFIGTEHLLLAITDEPECFAAQIIVAQGVRLNDIRSDIAGYFGSGT